jgi:hypothetical protein
MRSSSISSRHGTLYREGGLLRRNRHRAGLELESLPQPDPAHPSPCCLRDRLTTLLRSKLADTIIMGPGFMATGSMTMSYPMLSHNVNPCYLEAAHA